MSYKSFFPAALIAIVLSLILSAPEGTQGQAPPAGVRQAPPRTRAAAANTKSAKQEKLDPALVEKSLDELEKQTALMIENQKKIEAKIEEISKSASQAKKRVSRG